jgi:hypothetical protein
MGEAVGDDYDVADKYLSGPLEAERRAKKRVCVEGAEGAGGKIKAAGRASAAQEQMTRAVCTDTEDAENGDLSTRVDQEATLLTQHY